MAPRKGKETPLELCNRATVFGNTVAVRMLEYLSIAKHQQHGFRDLANDFLDICRILWAIEAGLQETGRKQSVFPEDIIKELENRFRQTNDDFLVLNQLVLRFLDYERKGALGKLQKGFTRMFADKDTHKMRDALARNRNALRMSAAVFRWSLGDAKVEGSIGIGYTGLVAALERMNLDRPSVVIPGSAITDAPPRLDSYPMGEASPSVPAPPPSSNLLAAQARMPPSSDPPNQRLPALPAGSSPSSPTPTHSREADLRYPTPEWPDRVASSPSQQSQHQHQHQHQSLPRGHPGEHASNDSSLTLTRRESVFSKPSVTTTTPDSADNFSAASIYTKSTLEDRILSIDLDALKHDGQHMRLKVDPATVPRWAPRQSLDHNPAASRSSLLAAVQMKKHTLVEQLLDNGTHPDVAALKAAVVNRDLDSVRLLLLFGAKPNEFDADGLTPLLAATKASFIDAARLLIKYGADPNLFAGVEFESPLALAVHEGNFDLVQLYMTYGGDATLNMTTGDTVLIRAMNATTPRRIVELMLQFDSDPNHKNREGKTALFEAIQASRIDLMTLLLDHGANPNLPGPKHMLWPAVHQPPALQLLLARGADYNKAPGILELATSINSVEAVTTLLKAGASPNVKKDGIYTPLCSAIRDNRTDLVAILLKHNADPNLMASEYPAFKCVTHHRAHLLPQLVAKGANIHSPKGIVEVAVAHNDKDALQFLLEHGASPNDKNAQGHTALTTAIRENHASFVDLLLANGADPGVRGQDWPLCMAVKRPAILRKLLPHIHNPRAIKGVMEMAVVANQLDSIKMLLQAGVSVEDKNGGVFSPLTTALREQNKEIVRFLLYEADANPNAPGEHLPIIKSIRRCPADDTEMIEMLLERGADINKMYRGWNAVLQAVENGDIKLLRLLIEKGGGVDLQAMDEESARPVIELVQERGWDEAVNLLTENASDNEEGNNTARP